MPIAQHVGGSVAGDLGFSEMMKTALPSHAAQSINNRYVQIDMVLGATVTNTRRTGLRCRLGATKSPPRSVVRPLLRQTNQKRIRTTASNSLLASVLR
jgi:hypothetical protein